MISNVQSVQSANSFILPQPFSLDFHSARLTEKQFERLCQNHPDLKFELSAKGELIVMPPTSMESGWRNSDINFEVVKWAKKDKKGIVFDSSTMFTFSNGAKRSPDVSWILKKRVEKLSLAERRKFARIVPDFVIELRSPSDALEDLQNKMAEYIENGVRLGWLIDPSEKKVYVYRQDVEAEILDHPSKVSGEPLLKEFVLNVEKLW